VDLPWSSATTVQSSSIRVPYRFTSLRYIQYEVLRVRKHSERIPEDWARFGVSREFGVQFNPKPAGPVQVHYEIDGSYRQLPTATDSFLAVARREAPNSAWRGVQLNTVLIYHLTLYFSTVL